MSRTRKRAGTVPGRPPRTRESPPQVVPDVERLLSRMREANERLIVAAVRAQDLSDDARAEAAQARVEVEHLMTQLREANQQLTAAYAHARVLAEDARHREEAYRQLSVRLLTLQDAERRRVALDLHDSTAQRLAALIMNLDLLERDAMALDARRRLVLAESRSLAEQCSREVRTLAYLLHPPLLDEAGLVPAVRWFVEGFSERSGIPVHLDLGEVGRLPEPIEMALFRIVQESLTNVHRHAATSTASIHLARSGDTVALDVRDRGRGVRDDVTHHGAGPDPVTLGVGIQGMRGRITQLGGTFDIVFTGEGTTVRVRVPLHGSAA